MYAVLQMLMSVICRLPHTDDTHEPALALVAHMYS